MCDDVRRRACVRLTVYGLLSLVGILCETRRESKCLWLCVVKREMCPSWGMVVLPPRVVGWWCCAMSCNSTTTSHLAQPPILSQITHSLTLGSCLPCPSLSLKLAEAPPHTTPHYSALHTPHSVLRRRRSSRNRRSKRMEPPAPLGFKDPPVPLLCLPAGLCLCPCLPAAETGTWSGGRPSKPPIIFVAAV